MQEEVLEENILEDQGNLKPKYAGFTIRLGALLIDILIYIVLAFVISIFPSNLSDIIVMLTMLAYKPLMEYQYGGTLGKIAVNVQVVNNKFQPITFIQSIIRNSPNILSQLISLFAFLFLNLTTRGIELRIDLSNLTMQMFVQFTLGIFMLISCITVIFDSKKQAIHDKMAKTYTIFK